MSDNLIEKLSGSSMNEKVIYNEYRLKAIQSVLQNMKMLNKSFLKKYERQEIWQKVNMGLMRHNIQPSLQNLVDFKVCQSNKPQRTYFNPFSKKPITVCYNKFIDQEKFNEAISYNMVLYYDSKTKKNMNWNELEDVVYSNVRALHISGTCKQNDRKCIGEQLQKRVFQKQRFKGKTTGRLNQIIMQGLQDLTPMTQIFVQES